MRKENTKIVVVDDHPLLREQLSTFIRYHGFTVLFDAVNGLDCIYRIEKTTPLPDLCLLDINMPEMDGLRATHRIKQTWPEIRIILYSMNIDRRTMEEARHSGADAVLPKSCQPDEIIHTIESLLGIC